MESSLKQIVEIVEKQTEIEISEITTETALEDVGIDSFDFIELVFAIEDKFGIEIDVNYNDEEARLRTVGEVVALVDGLIAAKKDKEGAAVGATAAA